MTGIERAGPDFSVDAALLAEAFAITQAQVQQEMRAGTITSRCEAGVEEDAGRWRLTFHRGDRAVRFIVDETGQVLTRASFPIRTG
ncbi:MAG TPA: DUF6522 family protein [Paracoccus solventivorans]|uniref:DUF6522 family protein n=1 Tax=Paracoccus solventivorans TaxID=53463 RepID=UPI002C11D229|nr:DUF6522 family protein [Paracoccus solventivorans]HMM09509.1 DUF6522 family protein [Paracoccus solventivorans]